MSEFGNLQTLGKVVCYHLLSGTVLNPDLFLLDPVRDEEISDVNVFGTFST